MDADSKRKIQIVFVIALILAGARTAWIFHERSASSFPEKAAPKERNPDDYVYLRPSHVSDLASAKKFLVGKTVWVRAGNIVAYSNFAAGKVSKCVPVKSAASAKNSTNDCLLPPLAPLDIKSVVMSGDQMLAVFSFAPAANPQSDVNSSPNPTTVSTSPAGSAPSTPSATSAQTSLPKVKILPMTYAVPIGTVKNGDATIFIDDMFFSEDPHKLYDHWSKETWAAVERHEITKGMTEAQAAAAMGVGRTPDSGAGDSNSYGNRTLVFTDPEHADKPLTVAFQDNAAVSVSR